MSYAHMFVPYCRSHSDIRHGGKKMRIVGAESQSAGACGPLQKVPLEGGRGRSHTVGRGKKQQEE